MRFAALFLHLAAAIFWMGGMAFVVMALRPALHEQLGASQRLPLMVSVLKRFFPVVIASIAVLLLTGGYMLLATGMDKAPPGWHAMLGLGVLMMLIFGHIFLVPWRRMLNAVGAADWQEGGKRANQIAMLVKINLGLGWLAIAAVIFWR